MGKHVRAEAVRIGLVVGRLVHSGVDGSADVLEKTTEYSWVNIFEARRSCPFPGGIKRLIIDVPEPTVESSRLIDF